MQNLNVSISQIAPNSFSENEYCILEFGAKICIFFIGCIFYIYFLRLFYVFQWKLIVERSPLRLRPQGLSLQSDECMLASL